LSYAGGDFIENIYKIIINQKIIPIREIKCARPYLSFFIFLDQKTTNLVALDNDGAEFPLSRHMNVSRPSHAIAHGRLGSRAGVYIQPQSFALRFKMGQDSSATSLQDYYIAKQESLSIWKLKIKELNSLKIWLNIMRHQVL